MKKEINELYKRNRQVDSLFRYFKQSKYKQVH